MSSGRPKFILRRRGQVIAEYPVDGTGTVTIGRRPDSTVCVDDPAVSRDHARIIALSNRDHDLVLRDLGSTNGTYVRGLRVERHILEHGDVIGLGEHELEYSAHGEAVDEPPPTRRLEQPPACLHYLEGPQAGARAALTLSFTPLGSAGTARAAVERRAKGYYLVRLWGDEPVYVNETPLEGTRQMLEDGDVVEFDDVKIRFTAAVAIER